MKWRKVGRIFRTDAQRDWMVTHSSVPTPESIDDRLLRIYFSPRDRQNRSHIAYLIIDINKPHEILELSEWPCLSPGGIGTFDHAGAMVSWLVHHEGRRWIYYIGWNLGVEVPWRTAIGLAYGDAQSEKPIFHRHSTGPIIDRSAVDPHFVTNPCVISDRGIWRMWYLSGTNWSPAVPRPLPRYNVRYAESVDGVTWRCTGIVCVNHVHPGEVAIGRPCVIAEDGVYKMWYSFRGDDFGYRIGYAESPDGLTWERLDSQAGIDQSESGWDSLATAYPTVFDHGGRRYLLYCGNNYSKEGFGLALEGT